MIILIFHHLLRAIEQFEKDNPNISITIFEYNWFHQIKEDDNDDDNTQEGTVIKDVRVSPHALKRKHLLELLIIKDKIKDIDTNEIIEKTHFTTIKSISRLFWGSKYDKGLYYCKKCYCSFQSDEKLENIHILLCTNTENVLTIMPEKN